MECRMDHIVLNVEDVEEMIRFYAELVGLSAERVEEYRSGAVPFPSVRLNPDTIIDLFPPSMWRNAGASGDCANRLNHFCVSTDKGAWDELLRRLRDHGVAIEDGPVPRWGAHGTGISVYFRDPEGNLVEARHYEGQDRREKCLLGS